MVGSHREGAARPVVVDVNQDGPRRPQDPLMNPDEAK